MVHKENPRLQDSLESALVMKLNSAEISLIHGGRHLALVRFPVEQTGLTSWIQEPPDRASSCPGT